MSDMNLLAKNKPETNHDNWYFLFVSLMIIITVQMFFFLISVKLLRNI